MTDVRPIDANALDVEQIPCYYGDNCRTEDVKAWLDDAPTLDYAPRQQWISVNDRLPDMCGMPCLLYGINQYGQGKVFNGFTGYMEHGKHSWHTYCSEDENFAFNVTHWMPLPEPPKEE